MCYLSHFIASCLFNQNLMLSELDILGYIQIAKSFILSLSERAKFSSRNACVLKPFETDKLLSQ